VLIAVLPEEEAHQLLQDVLDTQAIAHQEHIVDQILEFLEDHPVLAALQEVVLSAEVHQVADVAQDILAHQVLQDVVLERDQAHLAEEVLDTRAVVHHVVRLAQVLDAARQEVRGVLVEDEEADVHNFTLKIISI